jgi:hypothetical protein
MFFLKVYVLQGAMEYVFGSTFVCKTIDAAKEVCLVCINLHHCLSNLIQVMVVVIALEMAYFICCSVSGKLFAWSY